MPGCEILVTTGCSLAPAYAADSQQQPLQYSPLEGGQVAVSMAVAWLLGSGMVADSFVFPFGMKYSIVCRVLGRLLRLIVSSLAVVSFP